MKNASILKIYVVFSLIYLFILLSGNESLDVFLKPFLIPLLGLAVYVSEEFPSKKILLTALLFSWIGDVILIFADKGELYFILGLVSFLISHLIYCVLFSKQIKVESKRNKVIFVIGSLLIGIYLTGMLSLLLPTLGDLKIPVIVYASVISIMLLFAFNGFLIWRKPGNQSVFVGAVVFVVSDSILAINKFYAPIERNSFFIMLTYLVAQYLIVLGILKLNSKLNLNPETKEL